MNSFKYPPDTDPISEGILPKKLDYVVQKEDKMRGTLFLSRGSVSMPTVIWKATFDKETGWTVRPSAKQFPKIEKDGELLFFADLRLNAEVRTFLRAEISKLCPQ